MTTSAVRRLFAPARGTIFLDAATYGLPPRPTVAALRRALRAWQTGTANWVEDWDRHGEGCRALFASLIGAAADEVALVPAVSVGVALVAASLRVGDEALVPDDEFVSVTYPLLVARRERGIVVREVPLERLADEVTGRTRLVAFSLVQSQSGRVAALDDVLRAARAAGARVLVDTSHATPFLPRDDALARADYVVCAAYKHLLSPRGVAYLYVQRRRWDEVPPLCANWRSTDHPFTGSHYGGPLRVAATAARFDVSLAWHLWVGAHASMTLLDGWRRDGTLADALELARRLAEGLDLSWSGSTLVCAPVADPEATRAALAEAGIRAARRAAFVRLSPHVYNTPAEIDRAIAVMRPLLSARPVATAAR